VVEGVSAVNLSQRLMGGVVLAVLLFVVAGLVVSATQRASTQLDQTVAVLPGLAAAGVAALAIVATDRRERERLEHERWSRMRDERREAYMAYMAVCDRIHGGDHSPEAKAELRKIVEVVELVSLSKEVQDSVRVLTNHLILRTESGETETVSSQDESEYRALLGKFKKAIQRDLGITPTVMQDLVSPSNLG
jgi:hypothetical protein